MQTSVANCDNHDNVRANTADKGKHSNSNVGQSTQTLSRQHNGNRGNAGLVSVASLGSLRDHETANLEPAAIDKQLTRDGGTTIETGALPQVDKEENGRNKKLVSGKCAKPEESDIKLVIKYPHEKLDAKHIKDRKFDNLEFNILVAGELKIIACISSRKNGKDQHGENTMLP